MANFYLYDAFFNQNFRFEGGEGKRQRDALAERFSFLLPRSSDEITNTEKRACLAFTDAHHKRAEAALTVRGHFDETIGYVRGYANGDNHDGAPHRFLEENPALRVYDGIPEVIPEG